MFILLILSLLLRLLTLLLNLILRREPLGPELFLIGYERLVFLMLIRPFKRFDLLHD